MANKKISELNSVSLPLSGTEEIPIVQSGETKKIIVDDLRPYKVYTALLTQSGTDAPTAIVLENTLGEIVWSRTYVGEYKATLSGAFTENKTFLILTSDFTYAQSGFNYRLLNVNEIGFVSFDAFALANYDDILNNTSIEIRVYN